MKKAMHIVAVLGLVIGISDAAQADLVMNGGFETTTHGAGQMNVKTDAANWSTTGYNFIFTAGSADTTGAPSQYNDANGPVPVKLWGPNDGSNNGLPATSPDGGNFIAADGAFNVGAITQAINGLVQGQTYELGFWWAAAQQKGYDGATTDKWTVSLGNQIFTTPVLSIDEHGFSGWVFQTFDFTYTGNTSSNTLSFLATGTPGGTNPPFALLDGVTLSTTPEGSSMGLLSMGLLSIGGVGAFVRRRNRGGKPTS